MTTRSIAEHPGVARRGGDRRARGTASGPTLEALRAESHSGLTNLVTALGYPPHWADELERRAFGAGRVWSLTPRGDEAGALSSDSLAR